MTMAQRRSGVLAAAAAAAAIGLAGVRRHRLAARRQPEWRAAAAPPAPRPRCRRATPTQLLDEWATCMRSHGDPDQVDPTIDANKVIHITFPAGYNGSDPVDLGGNNGSNGPCPAYLTAASTALRGGKPLPKPDPAKLEKFSQCMRAHGIPDFPDPTPAAACRSKPIRGAT